MKKFLTLISITATLIATPFLAHGTAFQLKANELRNDIKEACNLITEKYIYLEDKLNTDRKQFRKDCGKFTALITEDNPVDGFITAMNRIRSMFKDGHFDWELNTNFYDNTGNKSLGVILTVKNSKVIVGSILPQSGIEGIEVGDEVIKWNGRPINTELKEMIKYEPQSAATASKEVAARNLTFDRSSRPSLRKHESVKIEFKGKNGKIKKASLEWNVYDILLTRNGYPSLEHIPKKQFSFGNKKSLIVYRDDSRHVIIHPRDFAYWGPKDLDKAISKIYSMRPGVLVVDLRDTAGGYFEQVVYLSRALGVNEPMSLTTRELKEDNKYISYKTDLDKAIKQYSPSKKWNGKTIFMINPICGSGCEFFARWMQINKRGKLVGKPTNGRGGGYDTFTLKNSKSALSIPIRDRRISGDQYPIEGHPVKPDIECHNDLQSCLDQFVIKR